MTSTSPFSSMARSHVAVRVPDFEAAKRWFVDKLDFRVVQEWPFGQLQLAYLAPATDDTFYVEIMGGEAPDARPAAADLGASLQQAGYHHFCMTVQSVDDAVAELRRRGVTVVGEPFDLAAINRRLAFFFDPWGNLIELAQLLA
jgi:glyoxylase I family protein